MIDQATERRNYLSRVRGVALLPQERVARVFSLEEGLLDEPTGAGQLLIATTQRILFFRDQGGVREATLVPVEDLKEVVVDTARKGTLSIVRGLLTLLAALVFYVVVAYWLTGQFEGPALPGIAMDIVPFALLAGVLVGGWLYWRHSVRRAGGKVTIQGSNWNLTFTVLGAERIPDVDNVVECLFQCRQKRWDELLKPRA